MWKWVLLGTLLAGSGSTAFAGPIFDHVGATDPATGDWSPIGFGGVATGAVTNDLGTGLDAWFTDDDLTVASGFNSWTYQALPSAAQLSNGAALGWSLSARLRVVDADVVSAGAGSSFGSSIFLAFDDGVRNYGLQFGLDGGGNTLVKAPTSIVIAPNGHPVGVGNELVIAGTGYHRYTFVFDPLAASVDLFVDGVELLSDYEGLSGSSAAVRFGAADSQATGRAHWNEVTFTIVPEPASAALLVLALCAIAGSRGPR